MSLRQIFTGAYTKFRTDCDCLSLGKKYHDSLIVSIISLSYIYLSLFHKTVKYAKVAISFPSSITNPDISSFNRPLFLLMNLYCVPRENLGSSWVGVPHNLYIDKFV